MSGLLRARVRRPTTISSVRAEVLPRPDAARVVLGEVARLPRHPRSIAPALARIGLELPEILRERRSIRPSRATDALDARRAARLFSALAAVEDRRLLIRRQRAGEPRGDRERAWFRRSCDAELARTTSTARETRPRARGSRPWPTSTGRHLQRIRTRRRTTARPGAGTTPLPCRRPSTGSATRRRRATRSPERARPRPGAAAAAASASARSAPSRASRPLAVTNVSRPATI